eukprot:1378053-Amorphochlora_amoeboformis.AAC.2
MLSSFLLSSDPISASEAVRFPPPRPERSAESIYPENYRKKKNLPTTFIAVRSGADAMAPQSRTPPETRFQSAEINSSQMVSVDSVEREKLKYFLKSSAGSCRTPWPPFPLMRRAYLAGAL